MNGSEPAPDTLRTCEACGGETPEECNFCTDGYQTERQARFWRTFRQRMRKISGTYGLLEDLVEELIGKLRKLKTDEADMLAAEGRDALHRWIMADPETADRERTAQGLRDFNVRALEFLSRGGPA